MTIYDVIVLRQWFLSFDICAAGNLVVDLWLL